MDLPPVADLKALVSDGYDRCAGAYSAARASLPAKELVAFADRLAPKSVILDIGCGSGVPVARFLASSFDVTGVDISARQIALCRVNVPAARTIHGDIMAQSFAPGRFDAIVTMYALFHLPRAEHDEFIGRLSGWLRVGGLAFLTVAETPEEGNVEEDFFGSRMFWSSEPIDVYRGLFNSHGLRVLQTGALGHGFSDSMELADEVHPFFVVERADGRT